MLVAVSGPLSDWLDRLTFADRTADEVTALVVAAITEWATAQGWRVYHRAPSVMRLPPPYEQQHSVIDVACARPTGPPLVIEVDRTDRRRTIDKLLAEAGAGRIPIWVRWGTGPFADPPPPIQLVTVTVTMRSRRYSRRPVRELPPPEHSSTVTEATAVSLLEPPDLAR
jgi:hypothetical protein